MKFAQKTAFGQVSTINFCPNFHVGASYDLFKCINILVEFLVYVSQSVLKVNPFMHVVKWPNIL